MKQLTPLVLGWPQWRGPQRNGHAVGARLPKTWPDALPKPKWQTPLGIGYSSPVIANGMVFLQGRDESSDTEVCYGIDDATGRIVWQYRYPSSFRPPDPSAGRGPNSTPTIDRDRVLMLGLGGMLHCFETRSGKILWKHDLKKEYWGVEKDTIDDAWFPVCGAAASALVVGDTFVLPVGGKKAGCLTAFDRKTGEIVWKALDDRSSYASPILADVAGVPQIIAFTGTRMVGLDAKSHALLWEFPFKAMYEQTIVNPVVWKNRVIVGGEARPLTALALKKAGESLSQEVIWQAPELCPYLTTPLLVDNHLIGFDQRSRRLISLDVESGKTLWTSPVRVGKQFVTLTGTEKDILALSDMGDLYILRRNGQSLEIVTTYKLGEAGAFWSQVAVVGNRLYVRDQKSLRCIVV